jgi:hypothetical protein
MGAVHRTYLYNAHGHALSGQILRPLQHLIDVQAAASLPSIGGHGKAHVDNFQFQDMFSFKAAYTYVSGSHDEESKSHTTLATSVVEGLNILDVVTADRVVARLSSQHPPKHKEPSITLMGSKFDNLRITGCPAEVELDFELFERLDTFEAMRNEFKTNANFRRIAEDPYQTGKPQKLPELHEVMICSLVKDMKTTCHGVKRVGHAFVIPQFGKVFVAEIVAKHSTRTLTMLRLELGSPTSANATVAEVDGNGTPLPPPPGGEG